ncbi:MFS transporter [Rhodococcus sp. T2V]|uniref:MFS transporter n=1 Tax=Rhodococcus sp. T2V TaxID=3034164 RepID=UPI0023E0FA7A|nr:MFS transporter [Rhodococcus sp. T2V]MDF3310050.1 MFS transporter [Rhodococcus sp. T2V]
MPLNLPHTRRRTPHQVTFAILAVSAGSFALLQSMTVPVLPHIEKELGTDQATAAWVLTAYLLSASVFTPIVGRLGDAFGKNRLLVVSLGFLTLGSLIGALAPSIGVLVAGRVVMGVGGGVVPLAFGIIRDELPPHRVAGGAGFISSLMAVGFGAGIVVAGPIVDHLGYHWLFWIPFAVTGAAAIVAAVLVPPSPVRTPARLPLAPAALLAGWLVALLLGISQGPRSGWTSWQVIALIAAGIALLAAWLVAERRGRVPLIDLTMMRQRGVWTSNLVVLTVGGAMYSVFAFLPQFLQTPASTGYGFGLDTTGSGLLILPHAVASFVCGLSTGWLVRRLGAKTVVFCGCLLAGSGVQSLVLWHGTHLQLAAANVAIGLGMGAVFASIVTVVLASVPPEQSGVATGMNTNIRSIGGAIGAAAMTTIVTSSAGPDGLPQESGYVHGFMMVVALMAISAATTLLLPSASRTESAGRAGPRSIRTTSPPGRPVSAA